MTALLQVLARVEGLVQSRCRAAGLEADDVDEVYGRTMVGLTPKLKEWADDPNQLLRYASGVVKNVIADVIGELEQRRKHVAMVNDEREEGEICADAAAPTEDDLIDRIDTERRVEAAGGIEKMKDEHAKKVEREKKRTQRRGRSAA